MNTELNQLVTAYLEATTPAGRDAALVGINQLAENQTALNAHQLGTLSERIGAYRDGSITDDQLDKAIEQGRISPRAAHTIRSGDLHSYFAASYLADNLDTAGLVERFQARADGEPDPKLVIYTRDFCAQSEATKAFLDGHAISYKEVAYSQRPDILAALDSAGHKQTPIAVTPLASWDGHQQAKLEALAATHDRGQKVAPVTTVYTTPSCVQCDATKRFLSQAGVAYQVVDLSQHPDIAAQLKSEGFRQAPVVDTGIEKWSGFQISKIQELGKEIGQDSPAPQVDRQSLADRLNQRGQELSTGNDVSSQENLKRGGR